MIYIRVDANSEIGMGHMMRCLSIADALVAGEEKVMFLIAGSEAADVLEQRGMPYIVLNTDYKSMMSECPILEGILTENVKILVDSYQVSNEYFEFLSGYGQVIYMDDVNAFEYSVDCIINGNIYGQQIDYTSKGMLRGCKYAPLRKEFKEARKHREPQNILITTGGSDPFKLTEQIVQSILEDDVLKKEQYDVVCGKFNDSYEYLCSIQEQYSNFHIHKDVKEMWKLMQTAKIAVTAGGTTMTELSCMGVPIVGFSFVDNQERITKTFFEEGYAHYGANYLTCGEKMFGEICQALRELLENSALCEEYSTKLMQLVDGYGCERIAEQIINM